ncbi:hypothetical protein ACOME3_004908 [Neoechinorhynchus agilis]
MSSNTIFGDEGGCSEKIIEMLLDQQKQQNEINQAILMSLHNNRDVKDYGVKNINNEKAAIDEWIRDMLVLYTPHEFVKKSALQQDQLSLEDVLRIAITFESTERAIEIIEDKVKMREESDLNRIWNRSLWGMSSDKIKVLQMSAFRAFCMMLSEAHIAEIWVKICGLKTRMQFDTGAAVSVIPSRIWEHIDNGSMEKSGPLTAYGGTGAPVLGKAKVSVRTLDVVVTDGEDTPSFGLPWAIAFGGDLIVL